MPGLGGASGELTAAMRNVQDAGRSLFIAKESLEGDNRHIEAAIKRLTKLREQGVQPDRMGSTILLANEILKQNKLMLSKIHDQVFRHTSLYGGIMEMM